MNNEESYKPSPVAGYLRSAKLGDAELLESEERIREYAKVRGYNLDQIHREDGVSGVTAYRPVLQNLIRDLRTQKYVGVIIPSLAHLASREADSKRLLARLRDYGWVEFIQE